MAGCKHRVLALLGSLLTTAASRAHILICTDLRLRLLNRRPRAQSINGTLYWGACQGITVNIKCIYISNIEAWMTHIDDVSEGALAGLLQDLLSGRQVAECPYRVRAAHRDHALLLALLPQLLLQLLSQPLAADPCVLLLCHLCIFRC